MRRGVVKIVEEGVVERNSGELKTGNQEVHGE